MGSGGGIRIVVVVLIILVVLYLFGGLRLPRCGFLLFKAFHRRPVRAKNIGALLVFWIGTMGIAFLAGYVPGVPIERLIRARLYEAIKLVKMTVVRVHLFEHDWASRTAGLLERAKAVALSAVKARWGR